MEPIAPSPEFVAFERYTRQLQERIVTAFHEVEPKPFELKEWTRPEGGGGRMGTVRGDVIEKGAVHVSSVSGASSPLTQKPFRAAGLSLILHPRDPHAPTVHMNVRRFEEPDDAWWGGGTDITPLGVRHDDDVERFHDVLRKATGAARYDAGKAEAQRYFFVPHRNQERGAGGVFYDHVRDDPEGGLVRAIGDSFLDAYLPILRTRGRQAHTDAEREQQLKDRGIYVEFNLLYDRGTRFGLQSRGNIDAILSSLPPLVRW